MGKIQHFPRRSNPADAPARREMPLDVDGVLRELLIVADEVEQAADELALGGIPRDEDLFSAARSIRRWASRLHDMTLRENE